MTHSRVESDLHARHRSQPARCPPRYRADAPSPRPRKPCPAASAHSAPATDPRTDPTDTRGPAPVGLARAFVAGVATHLWRGRKTRGRACLTRWSSGLLGPLAAGEKVDTRGRSVRPWSSR